MSDDLTLEQLANWHAGEHRAAQGKGRAILDPAAKDILLRLADFHHAAAQLIERTISERKRDTLDLAMMQQREMLRAMRER